VTGHRAVRPLDAMFEVEGLPSSQGTADSRSGHLAVGGGGRGGVGLRSPGSSRLVPRSGRLRYAPRESEFDATSIPSFEPNFFFFFFFFCFFISGTARLGEGTLAGLQPSHGGLSSAVRSATGHSSSAAALSSSPDAGPARCVISSEEECGSDTAPFEGLEGHHFWSRLRRTGRHRRTAGPHRRLEKPSSAAERSPLEEAPTPPR